MNYPVYAKFDTNPYTQQNYEPQYSFMTLEEMNTKFVIKNGTPIRQRIHALSLETATNWLKHEKECLDIWNKSPELFLEKISASTQKIKDLEDIIHFFNSVSFRFNREINP